MVNQAHGYKTASIRNCITGSGIFWRN